MRLQTMNGQMQDRPIRSLPKNQKPGHGFSLIELVSVVAIVLIVAAMAAPMTINTIRSYRLSAAASSLAGAIQSTRYQAIMVGCPYTLALTTGSINYQVQTQPITGTPPACSSTYSNVGGATPWANSSEVGVNTNVTFTFQPNGTVTSNLLNTPPTVFTVSVNNMTKTVTVSGVGNVKVK